MSGGFDPPSDRYKSFLTKASTRVSYKNHMSVKRDVQIYQNSLLGKNEFIATVVGLPRPVQAEVIDVSESGDEVFNAVLKVRIDSLDSQFLPNPASELTGEETVGAISLHGEALLTPDLPSVTLGQRVRVVFESPPLIVRNQIPRIVEVMSIDRAFAQSVLNNLKDSSYGPLFTTFSEGNFDSAAAVFDSSIPPTKMPYIGGYGGIQEHTITAGQDPLTSEHLERVGTFADVALNFRGREGTDYLVKYELPQVDSIVVEGPPDGDGNVTEVTVHPFGHTPRLRLFSLAYAYQVRFATQTFAVGSNQLYITSIYRSYSTQLRLYRQAQANKQAMLQEASNLVGEAKEEAIKEANRAGRLAAKPAAGPHMLGVAFDFSYYSVGGQGYPDTDDPRTQWMLNNAEKFGFKQTVSYENWHYEIDREYWRANIYNWNSRSTGGPS
jgi:hypothetical protein